MYKKKKRDLAEANMIFNSDCPLIHLTVICIFPSIFESYGNVIRGGETGYTKTEKVSKQRTAVITGSRELSG